MKTQAASTAYSEWLEQYKKDADITVNPMPKDVPYNVSLKGVTKVRPTIRRRLSNHGAVLARVPPTLLERICR